MASLSLEEKASLGSSRDVELVEWVLVAIGREARPWSAPPQRASA